MSRVVHFDLVQLWSDAFFQTIASVIAVLISHDNCGVLFPHSVITVGRTFIRKRGVKQLNLKQSQGQWFSDSGEPT